MISAFLAAVMEARWWLAQGMEEILFPSAGHFFASGMGFFLA